MGLTPPPPAIYRRQVGITSIVRDATGKPVPFDATAMLWKPSADDVARAPRFRAEEQEWDVVLGAPDASQPEKAESLRNLEDLAAFQKKNAMRSKNSVENLVGPVRLAITYVHIVEPVCVRIVVQFGLRLAVRP